MTLMPAFKIGVWNAWILTVYQALAIPFLFYIAGKRGATRDEELDLSTMQRIIPGFTKMLVFLVLIYSIFLMLRLGTIWFYIGIPITLLGLATRAIALVNWATTPPNEPITKGLYRYSRHPMYLSDFLPNDSATYYLGQHNSSYTISQTGGNVVIILEREAVLAKD